MNARQRLALLAVGAGFIPSRSLAHGGPPPGCKTHSACGSGKICGCDGQCYEVTVDQDQTCVMTVVTTVVAPGPRKKRKKRKKR